jgi:hypothetical protein
MNFLDKRMEGTMHCGHDCLWSDVVPESSTRPRGRRYGGKRAAQVDFPVMLMNVTPKELIR